MNTANFFSNSPPAAHEQIRVWDLPVRFFHWSLAPGFTIAYLTEDDLLSVHVWTGYTLLVLILIRFVWGFVGSQHARWSDFVKSPSEISAYLHDTVLLKAKRYPGHNPAGGAMVVALISSLTATILSGLAVYGGQELSGPLAPLLSGIPAGWAHQLEDLHEILANLTLALVFLHLAGVAVTSLLHRENLIKAMVTGLKNRESK